MKKENVISKQPKPEEFLIKKTFYIYYTFMITSISRLTILMVAIAVLGTSGPIAAFATAYGNNNGDDSSLADMIIDEVDRILDEAITELPTIPPTSQSPSPPPPTDSDATCDAPSATIIGTDGDDFIRGTNGDDVIVGLGGNDIIGGGFGNDVICGNEGDDSLSGEEDNDEVYGAGGADSLYGDTGNDLLNGGDDNDQVMGFDGRDTMEGGNGDDLLNGRDGTQFNDRLDGEAGTNRCVTDPDFAVNCEVQ
jgi:Ca2+-binding RTX toxin-like protein